MGIAYRTLADSDMEQWLDHVNLVFGVPREYFHNHVCNDPWYDPAGVFLALDDAIAPTPEIAATVRVFDREQYIRGRVVRMGGIGEVSTKQQYRRLGLSGQLLRNAVSLMRDRGMLLSLLGTGTHSHYARYGWHTIEAPFSLVSAAGEGRASGVTSRPLDFVADQRLMRTSYADLNGSFCGPIARDSARNGARESVRDSARNSVRESTEYWTKWVRTETGTAGLVVSVSGVDVGYARVWPEEDHVELGDFGMLAAYASQPGSVASVLAHLSGLYGKPLRVPKAIGDLCALQPSVIVRQTTSEGHAMWRANDVAQLVATVMEGQPVGDMAAGSGLFLGVGETQLEFRAIGGQVRVADRCCVVPKLQITEGQLLALLLVGFDSMLETGQPLPECDRLTAAALAAIFTPVGQVFWRTDGF